MYLNGPNAENVVKKSPAQPLRSFVPSAREGSSLFFLVFDVFESFERIPFGAIFYFQLRHLLHIEFALDSFCKIGKLIIVLESINYFTTNINVINLL